MQLYEINLNDSIIIISGTIDKRENPEFPLQSATIITRAHESADQTLFEMLGRSQIKVGSEGHEELPDWIQITVDDYGKIIGAEKTEKPKGRE